MEAPGEEKSVGGSATQLLQDNSVKATGAISGRGHQWRQPLFRKVASLGFPLITTWSGKPRGRGKPRQCGPPSPAGQGSPQKFESKYCNASRLSCYCSSSWESGPEGRAESLAVGGPAATRILTTSLWPLWAAMHNEVSPQSQHPVSPLASSGEVQEPVSGGHSEFRKDLVSVRNKGSAQTGPS